jgi:post-segregation antitoxin (ccd killing protein)
MRQPPVTEEDLAWVRAEADRMGITVSQLVETAVMGAVDALEDAIAHWQREQDEGVAA